MRGLLVLAVIGALVLIGGVAVASGRLFGPEGAQRSDVGERLASWAAAAKVGDHLALADLTDFSWDRVLVGGPYSLNKEAENQLGFAWDIESAPSFGNEGQNILAFADGNRVVAWSVVSRRADIWMPRGEDPSVYSKGGDEFFWDGHQLVPSGYYPY